MKTVSKIEAQHNLESKTKTKSVKQAWNNCKLLGHKSTSKIERSLGNPYPSATCQTITGICFYVEHYLPKRM